MLRCLRQATLLDYCGQIQELPRIHDTPRDGAGRTHPAMELAVRASLLRFIGFCEQSAYHLYAEVE